MLSLFFFSLSLHSYFTIQTDPRNLDVFKLRLYNRFLLHVRLLFLFTSVCLIQYYRTYILRTATETLETLETLFISSVYKEINEFCNLGQNFTGMPITSLH